MAQNSTPVMSKGQENDCDKNGNNIALHKIGYTNKGFDTDELAASNSYIPNTFTSKTNDTNPPIVLCAAASPPVMSDTIDFDDMLPHIGEFGTYQKILFLLMIPFAFFVAFVYFSQIFITLVPEKHWCRIPELHHLPVDQR